MSNGKSACTDSRRKSDVVMRVEMLDELNLYAFVASSSLFLLSYLTLLDVIHPFLSILHDTGQTASVYIASIPSSSPLAKYRHRDQPHRHGT